ncbi:MAG: penicillin-binding protein activator LpoB [Pseudobacteriovorax sp.]|nr:penicillin-binding protein activator LpoB [Pseudobacteriovorax sp.]
MLKSNFFIRNFVSLSALTLGLVACAPSFQGNYSDPAKAEIVDDKWNETDARKTAQTIVNSVLTKPWLVEYRARTKKRPVVIVDDIENRTDEHIDTKALSEFIRDELINSGKVRYLNNKRRKQILEEIKYQNSGTTAANTRKSAGKQIGADFLFGGAISSSVHSQGGLKTVTYQTAMTLTNLETTEISWSGKELIKKRFKRSGSSW